MGHVEDIICNINTQSILGMRHQACWELYRIEKINFRLRTRVPHSVWLVTVPSYPLNLMILMKRPFRPQRFATLLKVSIYIVFLAPVTVFMYRLRVIEKTSTLNHLYTTVLHIWRRNSPYKPKRLGALLTTANIIVSICSCLAYQREDSSDLTCTSWKRALSIQPAAFIAQFQSVPRQFSADLNCFSHLQSLIKVLPSLLCHLLSSSANPSLY